MFRQNIAVAAKRYMSAMSQSVTPMEDALRAKITDALKPSTLQIFNDSHKHAHHQAMQGVTSRETHVVSSSRLQLSKAKCNWRGIAWSTHS
ncbi:hypothetical protein SNOG_00120 [Parastagonospora nodorum SN15]|uniref:Uncharacterized protein n=1 Tax=Phaeosphaeria nodorum (strain SN15 / ATCC MYA-4574 / FGSC 10173) TaxID=321614 RepID=Q0V794_PHANO|nr:hypothetical protein SNOG_00120 [Parastagonospora nodorum SN15]EAT91615.2 hypothetical protein SNOG_00120 [Parastagonospora nodorum SN15]